MDADLLGAQGRGRARAGRRGRGRPGSRSCSACRGSGPRAGPCSGQSREGRGSPSGARSVAWSYSAAASAVSKASAAKAWLFRYSPCVFQASTRSRTPSPAVVTKRRDRGRPGRYEVGEAEAAARAPGAGSPTAATGCRSPDRGAHPVALRLAPGRSARPPARVHPPRRRADLLELVDHRLQLRQPRVPRLARASCTEPRRPEVLAVEHLRVQVGARPRPGPDRRTWRSRSGGGGAGSVAAHDRGRRGAAPRLRLGGGRVDASSAGRLDQPRRPRVRAPGAPPGREPLDQVRPCMASLA